MLHKEIIDKWLGKSYAESPSLGAQCVSWAKKYCEESGNIIGNFSGSALKWWTTWSPFNDKWQRVPVDPKNPPKEGSVIFFDKTKSNPYGHVAIVDSSTSTGVTIIEQNAGSGNGDGKGSNAIKRTQLSYSDTTRWKILWWFTLKSKLMETNETVSKYKQIYIQERPQGYKPIFSDYKEDGDTKYLIEIWNIRVQKQKESK